METTDLRIRWGDVVKWLNTEVCKTSIHRFESGRRLHFLTLLTGRSTRVTRPSAGSPHALPNRWSPPPADRRALGAGGDRRGDCATRTCRAAGHAPPLTLERATATLPQQGTWAGMDPSKLSPLRKGLLEFLILDIVSAGDVYVADILERLRRTDFATREGTLYPLLSRMRREGLLDYDWRESAAGPPRKYYRLTGSGTDHLAEFRAYWATLTALIEELGR